MPLLAALASLALAQESVTLRLNPSLDAPIEYVLNMEGELVDGSPLLNVRVVIAQRARREGPNFRFTRYVSAAFANVENTDPKLAKPLAATRDKVTALVGRSFPLLVDASGKTLPLRRGKYENASDGVPNFVISFFGEMPVGQARPIGDNGVGGKGTTTVREVRTMGADRAVILDFVPDPKEMKGHGTFVLSATDGLPLLVALTVEPVSPSRPVIARLKVLIRRQNVPGLDRLAADLRLDP